jgi:hypothetical protein
MRKAQQGAHADICDSEMRGADCGDPYRAGKKFGIGARRGYCRERVLYARADRHGDDEIHGSLLSW